ncbi:hypothetical protein BDK51DRAFT_47863 [Blyttiomyces helicus]|uniref:ABC transporter domain-containing protein n=1 Tax=Blyttiomyces helicus TaxID=388810 RepID=A0A4P9VYZ3_9FUNG|nr:hypothetical protein BDK51DRAFT_47863 [Blyttiomyces helicus]|eukprot:RKO83560.1 hypothetical protein BDK51DRAFT_47863 [Blyttiomyces helicus]
MAAVSIFFGDPYIFLSCALSGECLHASQVPGYIRPSSPPLSPLTIALMSLGAAALLAATLLTLNWARRNHDRSELADYVPIRDGGFTTDDEDEEGVIRLTSDDRDERRREALMSHHVPCTLAFRDVSYVIEKGAGRAVRGRGWFGARAAAGSEEAGPPVESGAGAPEAFARNRLVVLHGVHGLVGPGQVMAIMGGSGKSTFLDILARRNKSGIVGGEMLVNEKFVGDQEYRSIVGIKLLATLIARRSSRPAILLVVAREPIREINRCTIGLTEQATGITAAGKISS